MKLERNYQNQIRGHIWSDERRKNHSEAMKIAVKNNPDSYTSSNRGRTKQIEFDGVKFQGQWELDFYKYCILNNIIIERSKVWFDYIWEGNRSYNPDFYLPQFDMFIEIKGYQTERDEAKWKVVLNLKVLRNEQIIQIRNSTFDLVSYINQ